MHSRKAEDTVEVLRNSLPDLVQLTDPTWKLADSRIPNIDFIFEGPEQEAKVGVALLDNSSARLPHQLKSLCQQVEQRKDLHKLILIRDERLPFSSNATATRDRIKHLIDHDAVLHWISPEAVAALAAARSLLASVKAGDLSFEGQTVAVKTVSDWLALNMPASLQNTAEVLTLPATGRNSEHDLVERLQGYLVEQCVVPIDQVATALNSSAADLLSIVNDRGDLFGIIRGSRQALFSVRLANRRLTSSTLV